jgi:hypothetical protein
MAQATVSTYGGLVASGRPSEIPDGASPRTYDTDYLIGRVVQRPGEQNVYSYAGASAGPNPPFAAVDTSIGNTAWQNPANVLLDDGSFASVVLSSAATASSATSTGTSTGGGVAWTNPGNIDSNVSFASVSLSAGGANYTPSPSSGSVSNSASPSNMSPAAVTTILSGFASVAATSATLYVDLSATITASQGGGAVQLSVSIDSGGSFGAPVANFGATASATVPVTVSGITNLNTVQIRLTANAGCGPVGYANVSGSVTNWYATVSGGAQPTAQTLSAAISGLSIPNNATITGFEISFNADYTGAPPTFMVGLSVGNVEPAFTLTTSPAIYNAGGNGSLWGYSSWTPATFSSLLVNFFASSGGTTTVSTNTLVVTVYYTLPALDSDYLDVTEFTFAVSGSQSITGAEVAVKGYSPSAIDCIVQLLSNGSPIGNPKTFALPVSNGTTTLGSAQDSWGTLLLPPTVNASTFGARIYVSGGGSAFLDYVTFKLDLTPAQSDFNFVHTFMTPTGDKFNIALDSLGNWYGENATQAPGVLNLLLSGTTAGSYGSGATVYNRAFVANSTLTGQVTGSDIPRQYNFQGQWWDRITQVGPAAPPTVTASTTAGTVLAITNYSVTSNVVTLDYTGTEPVAGEVGTFSGLASATFLNGQTLNILGTGLTPTQFQVAFTHANMAGTADAGTFTPQYTYPVTSITQPPAMSDPDAPGKFNSLLWSAGPGNTSAGNTITVYYSNSYSHSQPDTVLVDAFNAGYPVYVYIKSAPFGNGIWQVTSVGNAIPPGGSYYRWYFTYQVPTSSYQKYGGPDDATGYYEVTQATVTTAVPVPGLAPGAQISIAGASVAAWDGVYPVVAALNSGAFNISQTALASGVATYTWALVSGSAPASGQLVTITNTLNANGILNVTDALIASATGTTSGTFTVSGFASSLTYPTTVEQGQATTAGTQFIIDPASPNVGSTTANPILGNSTGGSLTVVGASAGGNLPIGAGTRQLVVLFVTRNGFYTAPSPPVTFAVALGANYVQMGNIPIGPPNVIARVLAMTQAGQNGVPGANFYTSIVPITFTVGSTQYTSSSFLIADNQTTTVKLTFSDAVLLQSQAIDVVGNNLFDLVEIGNPAAILQYADRTFYIDCQNKVQNFNNLSFDGGYIQPTGGSPAVPLGWSIDPAYSFPFGATFNVTAFSITSNVVTVICANTLAVGANVLIDGLTTGTYLNGTPLNVLSVSGTQFTAAFTHADVALTADAGTVRPICTTISLRPSPVAGNSLYIQNQTAATRATLGMLTQSAYQDAWFARILNPNGFPVPYSVRVTARTPSGAAAGNLVLDLTDSNQGAYGSTYGTYTLPLASMTNQMATYTGTLTAEAGLATVPAGLLLRAYLTNVPAGADVDIDRIEVFPTDQPVLTNTVLVSYPSRPEAVDGVTGQLTLNSRSQDPVLGATVIHNQLCFKKSNSIIEVEDAPNYEPNRWTAREVSERVGTCGPNSFAQGDEWDISLHPTGFYLYTGGVPMPISRELQGMATGDALWDTINWQARQTFWVANDLTARRFYAGVAMATPNFWLPDAPVNATPASPNVILMCNYDGCPTAQELEGGAPVHVTMFGNVKAMDMRRKWSIWQIVSPYGAIVEDGAQDIQTVFLGSGTGTGKIYRLLASNIQMTDDGTPIAPLYTTSGQPGAEKSAQLGLGSGQKYVSKWMANVEGQCAANGLKIRHLPNTLDATYPVTAAYTPALTPSMQNNIEWRAEVRGQRIYVEFSMAGTVAGYFELGEMMFEMTPHQWGAFRGVSS